MVGVLGHRTMAGEMLAHRRHPGPPHTLNPGPGQGGDHQGLPVESPITDHPANPPVQVQHRGKAEIHPTGPQFGGHQPAGGPGQGQGPFPAAIEQLPQPAGGRQPGKALPKTLHPPPLLIHGDQQPGMAQLVDGSGQGGQLIRGVIVTAKQDHPPHQGMEQ